MRSEQLSQEDALGSLRQSCEFVSPNDGFLEQLKMFEEVGFKVDRDSQIYKKFRLKVIHTTVAKRWTFSSLRQIPDCHPTFPPKSLHLKHRGAHHSKTFRCKKCRRIVALLENVMDHIPGEGESSLSWHKRKGGNPVQKQDEECSSIFIEPLQWTTGGNTRLPNPFPNIGSQCQVDPMNDAWKCSIGTVEEGALEGRLPCIHCDARLGYFNWSGIQCSCGSWITPAFQPHKGQVDICTI